MRTSITKEEIDGLQDELKVFTELLKKRKHQTEIWDTALSSPN